MSTDESAFFSTMSAYFGPGTDWRSSTGKGVTVAVIDSGIDDTHKDLSWRVVESVEARVEKNKVIFEPSEAVDSAGHGTACAGIIARIAPEVRFASVKVLGAGGL